MLKPDEVRALSDADLTKRVAELEEEQFRLKFRSATEPLEQPMRLRTVRRDIARCLTILRERQIAASGERPSAKTRRRASRLKPAVKDDRKSFGKKKQGGRAPRAAAKSAT